MEKAGGADKDVGNIRVALGSFEVPAAVGKPRRDDLLFEADEFGEPAVARNLLDVRPDLVGRRIFARPVVVGLERKLVLTGQNVDKETGKGVVPPGPADFAGLFVNGEINARALQGFGHEQARDARAGDDNPKFPISHQAPSPSSGTCNDNLEIRDTP